MNLPKQESDILQQIAVEYRMAYDFVAPKRIETQNRYKLYSNQKKDKELVSDTLGFAVFQTVHSKLYDDRLTTVFKPGHPDDTDKVDGLNLASRYDYYKMSKDQFDFDWDWYACMWGAGFLDVSEWNAKKKLMAPSVVNNATLLVDPDGTLPNGDARGFGAYRFWGREISKTKFEMKAEGYEGYENLQPSADFSSLQYIDKVYIRTAQNEATPAVPAAYENDYIPVLEWWTYVNGERWLFCTDVKYTKIIRAKKWTTDYWPLIARKLFPIPNDPFGVSIFDLVEDKQRARSILTNLGLQMAKADLYGMYIYDRNIVSPTTDLSFGQNKWIPADGDPRAGVMPLPKPQVNQIVNYIMDLLDQGAQKATAATSMQQGGQTEKSRSANEVVRAYDSASERISTSAKVFAWSEKEFWIWWLRNNQKYLTSLHEKFVRIDGPFGPKFETFTGKNFALEDDPDIYIESQVLMDAKSDDKKRDTIAFNNMIANDQSVNRRYWNKRNARLFGVDPEEVDRLYPPTPDEMIANEENIKLNKNVVPKININDDHQTHLLIHAKADDTKAAIVHIEAHKKALMIKRAMNQAAGAPPATPSETPSSAQGNPNPANTGSAPAASPSQAFSVQQ